MKKLLILMGLLFYILVGAQNGLIKKYSFAIDANYAIALGDNFLNKGYKDKPGFDIEFQYNLKRNFFTGIGFQATYTNVYDKNLIGNFDSSYSLNLFLYGGYRHFLKPQKLYLEHRIGLGHKEIINKSDLSNYYITGTTFLVASKVNYCLNANWHIYSGFDYNYTHYNISLVGPYRNFFSNSHQIIPVVGIKYLFGRNSE